jgi:hypothetical protein
LNTSDFIRSVTAFAAKTHAEKLKLFGWYLHTHLAKERFAVADLSRCYAEGHLDPPGNISRSVQALTEKQPPDLLHDALGYRLAHTVREGLDQALGRAQSVVVVEKMLADLPGQISDEGERVFLVEALVCYRHGAFRAAIVMAWNLAYDHILRWLLADQTRLATFNANISKRNSKKSHLVIRAREDFEDLKEDETIDIIGSLPGVSGAMKRLLKEKLGRRNTYAHPSLVKVERAQVDDMITDLVNNVVLVMHL